MTILLTQLTQLFIDFVENNFVRLLSDTQYTHKQALNNWEQFKTQIQVQNIQRWKLEDIVRSITTFSSKVNCTESYSLLNQSYPSKNIGSTFDSGTFNSFYINEKWDKTRKQNSKTHSLGSITGLSFLGSPSTKQQNDLSFHREQKYLNKQYSQRQSIETLLGSFKKLCTNFENNHKKLVRDELSQRYF